MASRVLGIDLGTTNCCVALVKGDKPRVLSNQGGYTTTPSYVAVTAKGRQLVGHLAKRQAVTNAEQTAFAVKRLIGQTWDSTAAKAVDADVPFEMRAQPGGGIGVVLGGEVFAPEALAARLLQEMRHVAEMATMEEMRQVVITVPAHLTTTSVRRPGTRGRLPGWMFFVLSTNPPQRPWPTVMTERSTAGWWFSIWAVARLTFPFSTLTRADIRSWRQRGTRF